MTIISSYFTRDYAANVKPTVTVQALSSTTTSDRSLTSIVSTSTKPFVDVALDARAALNIGYQNVGVMPSSYTTGAQWEAIGIDKLDRRTLYAIASNQGGLFSKLEMDAAQETMTRQQATAMMTADPQYEDEPKLFKVAIDFLDTVSAEEKSSLKWAQERGAAQAGYLSSSKNAGRTQENVDTGNPIVNLFAQLYDELTATHNAALDPRDMPSWTKALVLWQLQNETTEPLSWRL